MSVKSRWRTGQRKRSMQKIAVTKKSKHAALVKTYLWSAFCTLHREKPRGSVPAGSARKEKQPLYSWDDLLYEKRYPAIEKNYPMSVAFKKVQPCGSHLTAWVNHLIWKKCTVGEHECWPWCFVLAHPYQAGCSDSLQFIDQDGEDVGKFGIISTGSVEICFLLHPRLERVTVCHCLVDYGRGVLALSDSCALGTSLWVCKRLRVTGRIWSFSAWAYGTKVGTSFIKDSFPCCRELYHCNPSGTKEGLFLVWSVMNLAITCKGEHSSRDFWHFQRCHSQMFQEWHLYGLKSNPC